jgi:hypothetical protein
VFPGGFGRGKHAGVQFLEELSKWFSADLASRTAASVYTSTRFPHQARIHHNVHNIRPNASVLFAPRLASSGKPSFLVQFSPMIELDLVEKGIDTLQFSRDSGD